MSRSRSPQGRHAPQLNEDEEYAQLAMMKRSSGVALHIKYVPFALIFSLLEVALYVAVGSVNLTTDLPYLAVAYVIGVAGLAVSYSLVAQWVEKKRAAALKGQVTGSEHIWFTLFYNNAFYVFLVFLGSHLLFSTLPPTIAIILTQAVAVGVPAWMSGLAK
jgi:hypothetical protein